MRASVVLLGSAMAFTVGCYTAPAARDDPMVVAGRGATVDVHLRRATVSGELIEASDTALIVARESQLILVPRPIIRSIRVRRVRGGYIRPPIEGERLRAMARLSRYPGGMSVALRDALLRQMKQDSLVVARSR